MKSRAWSGSKLFDTFMEFLKSAEDIARHSITAFCPRSLSAFVFNLKEMIISRLAMGEHK